MADKTDEFSPNFENKVLVITPDKHIKHYSNVIPSTEHKDYPFKGRLDVVVNNIRGVLCQAIYVTVFGKTINDASIQLHKAEKELGL